MLLGAGTAERGNRPDPFSAIKVFGVGVSEALNPSTLSASATLLVDVLMILRHCVPSYTFNSSVSVLYQN